MTGSRQNVWLVFFIGPGLLVVLAVVLFPLFLSLFNSLFAWDYYKKGEFVGLANFKAIFTQYPYAERFFNALRNNAKWIVTSMIVQNGLGLFFAYFFSRRICGTEFYKRVFFLPVLFSIIAVGFLWSLYLTPTRGLVDVFLRGLGIESLIPQNGWLGEASLATYVIITVNIWRWTGFPTLVFYAAINNISQEIFEAAYIDGIKEGQLFWRIILPLIFPAITIVTVLTLIGSLNVFEQVVTMAGYDGGPYYSTDTLATLFFRTAFGGSQSTGIPEIAIGSALSVVIYLLTFLFAFASIASLRRREQS